MHWRLLPAGWANTDFIFRHGQLKTKRAFATFFPGLRETRKEFLAHHHVSGLFHHCLLARHMTSAGFQVRQIEKMDNHADVWVVTMWRWKVPSGLQIEWAGRQVCLFFRNAIMCDISKRKYVSQFRGRGLRLHLIGSREGPVESSFKTQSRAGSPDTTHRALRNRVVTYT